METTLRNQSPTRTETAVNTALHRCKKPELQRFAEGRTVQNISTIFDKNNRRQFRVTFRHPSSHVLDARLIVVGERGADAPPIAEVVYIDIDDKIVGKKERVFRKVVEAIEGSFKTH